MGAYYIQGLFYDPADGSLKDTTLDQQVPWAMTPAQIAAIAAVPVAFVPADYTFAAIQAAIDAAAAISGGGLVLLRAGTYTVSSTIAMKSNVELCAYGPVKLVLAAGVNSHVIRAGDNTTNWKIRGIEIDGNKANQTAGHGITSAGGASTLSYVTLIDCHIHDCFDSGVCPFGTVEFMNVYGCLFENNGAAGLSSADTIEHFTWHGNIARNNGTHGMGLLGIGKHGTISGNVCADNGQAVPPGQSDNFTGYNAACENLTITGNTSEGGGNHGFHFGGNGITYTGNTVKGALYSGIYHQSHGGLPSENISMSGNTVEGCGDYGGWIENTNSGSLGVNSFFDNGKHGLALSNCANLTIGVISLKGNGWSGLAAIDGSGRLTISGIISYQNAQAGLLLADTTDSTITGCTLSNNTGLGIEGTGTEGSNLISGNTVKANTAGQIDQLAATTRCDGNLTSTSNTIASAATLTLPPDGRFFNITGTTNITTLTASWQDRIVVLRFGGALTISNGTNMSLVGGSFVTTANDTLTLAAAGAEWFEVARSVN